MKILLTVFILCISLIIPYIAKADCVCNTPSWFTPEITLKDGSVVAYDRISRDCPNVNQCSNETCEITTGGGESVVASCIEKIEGKKSKKSRHPDSGH